MAGGRRHFTNKFPDYSDSQQRLYLTENADKTTDFLRISEKFKDTLSTNTTRLLQTIEENESWWSRGDDYSLYTGISGIAYMFYRYGSCFNKPEYIDKPAELLRRCVRKMKSKRHMTFLTGIAGPLALGAVVTHSAGNAEESHNFISELCTLCRRVTNEDSDMPDELLYGRTGYLSSLLFVNANISPAPIEAKLITQVIDRIIKSGKPYSRAKYSDKTPLMYSWHDKDYLGAAHGLGGILYILLQAREYLTEKQLKEDIHPALHYLRSLKFDSGNFPSSIGNHSDRLVQWCHGAPGLTALFCLAHQVLEDPVFLETAIQCGDVTWERGLLTKGYSICHGVAGNAYAFLALFQRTKDAKHLYRACRFAEWCFEYGSCESSPPDRPFSLFEGLAGVIYFLSDMQQPHLAKFPAYSI